MMWSRSFLSQIGIRLSQFEQQESQKSRRRNRRHASSSNSEKSTKTNSSMQQNGSSAKRPGWSWMTQATAAVANAAGSARKALENVRLKAVDVKVDVDFVKPALVTIQTAVTETAERIPPPVRKYLRYLGVAFLSFLVTNRFNQRTIRAQRAKIAQQDERIEELALEVVGLQSRKRSAGGLESGDFLIAMGNALAQSAQSAARAAEAAAIASESCALRARRAIRPVPPPPSPTDP